MLDILFGFFFDFLFFRPFLMQRKKETRQEWSAIVEEKEPRTRHFFSKYADTRKKLRMGKDAYDLYREGKRYIKTAGTYLPDLGSAS